MSRSIVAATIAVILVIFAAPLAPAQERPPQFIQILTIKVHPSGVESYEDFVKKLVAAHQKAGAEETWTAAQTALGGPGFTYMFAIPFDEWGERDTWISNREALSRAYGEDEADKLLGASSATIVESQSEVFALAEELTTHPNKTVEDAEYFTVTRTELKPESVSTYRHLLSRYKDAEEASPGTVRAVRRFSARGPAFVSLTIRALRSFAEVDDLPVDVMSKPFGDEEARRIGDAIMACIRKRDLIVLQARPDLSYAGPSRPTN